MGTRPLIWWSHVFRCITSPMHVVRRRRWYAHVDGGRVALIDMVSPDDPAVALTYNHLERLRDPSHVRALTADELQGLVREVGYT